MNKKKKLIFSVVMGVAFSFQTVKADSIFCPQQLLCNKNIHNNLVCSTNVKTNFENWVVVVADPTFGPVRYLLTSAFDFNGGRNPECVYREVGQYAGRAVVIMSFNKYYPSGLNWQTDQFGGATCPTVMNGFIPKQTCPFSTTPERKFI